MREITFFNRTTTQIQISFFLLRKRYKKVLLTSKIVNGLNNGYFNVIPFYNLQYAVKRQKNL